MPARPIPGLKMVCLKLAPADIESITAIDREATARTGRLGSRTRAVRWAIRELTARLFLERLSDRGRPERRLRRRILARRPGDRAARVTGRPADQRSRDHSTAARPASVSRYTFDLPRRSYSTRPRSLSRHR